MVYLSDRGVGMSVAEQNDRTSDGCDRLSNRQQTYYFKVQVWKTQSDWERETGDKQA